MKFSNVSLESWGVTLPDRIVTSREIEEQIAPFCQRLNLPKGFFEIFTGIKERRLWPATTLPSEKGVLSAKLALEQVGLEPSDIDCLIHVSVSRDALEPATAAPIHHALGLKKEAFFFDLSNACLGFLNGALILSSFIEQGIIKRGLLVGTEISTPLVEKTIKVLLEQKDLSSQKAYEYIPSLTLGCGSAAWIVSQSNLSKTGHRFLGCLPASASAYYAICQARPDTGMVPFEKNLEMKTEANPLMKEAMKLAGQTWPLFKKEIGWSTEDIDHFFGHQVGREPREELIKTLGLPSNKDYSTFQKYGNIGSCSLPITLAEGTQVRKPKSKDKIALLGFGSGINCLFAGMEW